MSDEEPSVIDAAKQRNALINNFTFGLLAGLIANATWDRGSSGGQK